MVSLTGKNAEACKIILTKGLCMFQFLGDPHLTISHVNYKLDQVKENRQQQAESLYMLISRFLLF